MLRTLITPIPVLIRQARLDLAEAARFPSEQGWLAGFPEIVPLVGLGIPRRKLYLLFVRHWPTFGHYWIRIQPGRDRPDSHGALEHQERMIACRALLCGFDQLAQTPEECRETRLLLDTFWRCNDDPGGMYALGADRLRELHLSRVLEHALAYTLSTRESYMAKKLRAKLLAKLERDPVWCIQNYLARQDGPRGLQHIIAGTGLNRDAVRKAIQRDREGRVLRTGWNQYALGKPPEALGDVAARCDEVPALAVPTPDVELKTVDAAPGAIPQVEGVSVASEASELCDSELSYTEQLYLEQAGFESEEEWREELLRMGGETRGSRSATRASEQPDLRTLACDEACVYLFP